MKETYTQVLQSFPYNMLNQVFITELNTEQLTMLPTGELYISSGLVGCLDSGSLAFLFAHELGHVFLRHRQESLKQHSFLSILI